MPGAFDLHAIVVPLAHEAETWLGGDEGWIRIFYVMPVLIVLLGSVASARAARRHRRETDGVERG